MSFVTVHKRTVRPSLIPVANEPKRKVAINEDQLAALMQAEAARMRGRPTKTQDSGQVSVTSRGTRTKIVAALRTKRDGITATQVVEASGLSYSTVWKHLREMLDAKELINIGTSYARVYVFAEEANA